MKIQTESEVDEMTVKMDANGILLLGDRDVKDTQAENASRGH